MLNENLPLADLQLSLESFLESFDFLLSQIDPEQYQSIYTDKQKLAKLHHALNLDKYSTRRFREQLLLVAPNSKIVEFAKKTRPNDDIQGVQSEEFRVKLAGFKWGDNNATREFVHVFGYEDYLVPIGEEGTTQEQHLPPSDNPFKQLKDYQTRVVFKALESIESPNARFLIHMPTGAGKTRVAMEIISYFLNRKKGLQVVWLVDRKELGEQAMDAFMNVWSHLGKYSLNAYRIWGDAPVPEKLEGSAFAVAMYQKIRGSASRLKADLVVPDEAHIAVAPTYSATIDELRDRRLRQTRIMGLTATPGRGSGMIENNNKLSEFFHTTMIGIDDGGGTIESLQNKGILAKCEREVLSPNIDYRLTKEEWRQISMGYRPEFPEGMLERIANDNRRTLQILLKLRNLGKSHERVLVFCGSVKQSKIMSSIMGTYGHPSAYVTGSSPDAYRKDTVGKFRDGNIQFLFNYNVFTAGFDVPKIDAVVIARPTTSVVLYGQMIGRGMRGHVMGGTTEFTLVDVVDNIITEHSELDAVHEYFAEYWMK